MTTELISSMNSLGSFGPALGAVLALIILRNIYYAFIHPLSKVPGPKLYSFWDLPYLYHLLRGTWPHKLKQLHDAIYGRRTGNNQLTFEKDPIAYRPSVSGHPHIIVANGLDHRRQRRLLSHAFPDKALRNQEDIMQHYTTLFISNLTRKSHASEVVDIVKWYNFLTFDLIGDLAFGQSFSRLSTGNYHPWVAMIFNDIKLSVFSETLRRYPILSILKSVLLPKKLVKSQMEHWELSRQTAKKRLAMSEGEIVENANLLIVAGSETTATQLSGTTFCLLKDREGRYERLVGEIRGRFVKEEDITLQAVSGLEYMDACFEEGFRMYPPAPLAPSRRTPEKGEHIGGYRIPGNTAVGVPQWASYQSEANFRDADKFIPERWLGDPKYAEDVRGVLQPFLVGPRNCMGKNLAYAEMRLILARLLWNFDLELMPESENWNDQKIYVLWEKGAYPREEIIGGFSS